MYKRIDFCESISSNGDSQYIVYIPFSTRQIENVWMEII